MEIDEIEAIRIWRAMDPQNQTFQLAGGSRRYLTETQRTPFAWTCLRVYLDARTGLCVEVFVSLPLWRASNQVWDSFGEALGLALAEVSAKLDAMGFAFEKVKRYGWRSDLERRSERWEDRESGSCPSRESNVLRMKYELRRAGAS